MRSFLTVFVSSLLLSVPVHSHLASNRVHPHDLSDDDNHVKSESKAIQISVKIDSVTWETKGNGICKKKDDNNDDGHDSSCSKESAQRIGFRCRKKFFNQELVMAAAHKGCKPIRKNYQKGKFPRTHLGGGYTKKGSYVEWPLNKNGKVKNLFGSRRYRLVMTLDCTVVGAVVVNKNGKGYKKCKPERH